MNSSHWLQQNSASPTDNINSSHKKTKSIKKKIQKHNLPDPKISELYKQRKLFEIVQLAQLEGYSYEEYDQIKIHNKILNQGDNIIINNEDQKENDFIGTIISIISVKEPKTNKLICLCKVKWYVRKQEIITHKPRCKKWISDQEIFVTQHQDLILAQTIIDKCQVLNCHDYTNLAEIQDNIFFTRLTWDDQSKSFPNYKDADRYCVCDQPWNPDLQYIQCDKCSKWYHFECVDVENGQYEDKDYICYFCKEQFQK